MNDVRPYVIHEHDCTPEEWQRLGHVKWRTLISGDRTPTDALTIGVAEIESGDAGVFALHQHVQIELYYILSGEGIVTIAGEDYAVRPGSAAFIPSGAEHGARNTGEGMLRLLYVFSAQSFTDVEYQFPQA